MPRTRKPYPPEFSEQLVALVRAGRTPEDLARECKPTAQSISNWVAQADRDAGRRTDGLTTAERAELTRLRRENRQLKVERDILSKAAAWFAHESESGHLSGSGDEPAAGRLRQRILCLGPAVVVGAGRRGHRADGAHPCDPPALERRLKRLRTERKRAALKSGDAVAPWVFLTPDGHAIDGDNLRNRVFYRLLEKAGLRKIRLHDLRHTYASLLIQQGESLAYVQQQLGHSSIQVTVDVYGHLIPGANRAAVDRLDARPTRNPDATQAKHGA